MAVTYFGLVFLPVVLAALMLRREWLFPLLIISAALHAPAVAVLSLDPATPLGITPWLTVALACSAHLLGLAVFRRSELLALRQIPRQLWLGWICYFALALGSAFLLPHLFRGIGVFPLSGRSGFDAPLMPLEWTPSNFVQALNAGLIAVLGIYAAVCAARSQFRRRIVVALLLALALSAALSFYQRAEWHGWLPALDWIGQSLNPSYVHELGWGIHQDGVGTPRMAWPFAEPSYASVWFAAFYGGGLSLLLFTRHPWLGGVCTLAAGLALLNSFGMSGVAAAATATAMSAVLFLWRIGKLRSFRADALLAPRLLVVLLLVLAMVCAWQARNQVPQLRGLTLTRVYELMVAPRLNASDVSGQTRSRSNAHAAEVVMKTWGLGAGLGSNRASSYFTAAASNVGVAGLILLLGAIGTLLASLARRARDGDALAAFLTAASGTALVGVALGIPDLNWPAWWIWLLLGFALVTRPAALSPGPDTSR